MEYLEASFDALISDAPLFIQDFDIATLSYTPRIVRFSSFAQVNDDSGFRIDISYQTVLQKLRSELRKSNKRKRATEDKNTERRHRLTLQAVTILQNWFNDHLDYPYPTDAEKEELCQNADITLKQLVNWFTNTRKRIWPRYKQAKQK